MARTRRFVDPVSRSLFDVLDKPDPPLRAMTIASSSAGNCTFVQAGETRLLVDIGVSLRRVEAALEPIGQPLFQLSAVVVTHTHSDHISSLGALLGRFDIPVIATAPVISNLFAKLGKPFAQCPVKPLEPTSMGAIDITAHRTSHDSPGCCGFLFAAGQRRFGVLTDSGIATPDAHRLVGCVDALVLETNHDLEMLMNGPYPRQQKQRIRSDRGHLSNADAAALLVNSASPRLKRVMCAHISDENNTPDLAIATLRHALAATSHLAHVEVSAAPRDTPSPLFTI